ncbi:sugar ABC transporter permease [Paenibacillus baekrokdamisoli]|uniref:Sugar ABC transporter permease n=1 Tax=Paenibacillus baekrokdamisoli TaxID=1712516 RepID=A0A3G9IV73_9BACL|nr:carbohydrate ABC transporter permease [Paenibacillus baekrokdamisoli]MBB3070919.1 raffinose/stachyose/melibiose transport system permease protein [Paenibacillus baekrokdamisoli]BBH22142.1 sugar ABC transporter permease [Paenibacillus baekrokdamisoli]
MRRWQKGLLELISLVLSGIIAVPLFMVVVNSLKNQVDAADLKLTLPKDWSGFNNYTEVFRIARIPQAFLITLIITVVSVVLIITVCTAAAFVIERRDSRFTRILQHILIAGMILPGSIITTYYLMQSLHLIRTFTGVILLYVASNFPFMTYLYISFLRGVPKELDEAAIIDGIGRFKLFFKILFPLLMPVNASVIILASMNIWNDFQTPFYFLNTASRYTLSMTIYFFFGQHSSDWNLVFADIVMVSLPVILLYLFMQKYIVSGLTAGAVKG